MVATIFRPVGAEDCLKRAESTLDQMDPEMWQTRLLKSDNNKVLADLNLLRHKNGLIGQDLTRRIGETLEGRQ